MVGTILNVAGILLGGVLGLSRRKILGASGESFFKVSLGALTVYYGLRLVWVSISAPFVEASKRLIIVVLALMIGKLAGKGLRLQKLSNRLGQTARERIAAAKPDDPERAGKGFRTCAGLFCAAPLGILGALEEGLTQSEYFQPLAIKAVLDGLASMWFASVLGWGVLLAAVPVLVIQGGISLVAARVLQPILSLHNLMEPVNAVAGLLVFCVALVMLGLKRIELADYLPALIVAPLIASIWR